MYPINYFAVLVTAILYFAIGAVWYSPLLFGKMWMAELGKTEEQIRREGRSQRFIGAFLSALVLCYILANFLAYVRADSFLGGLITGFMAWIGFVATIMAMNGLFQGTSFRLYLIDSGYALVGMLIAGVILAVW